jgi:CheY-like chemotaxis protein
MTLILAVEPDPRQASRLSSVLRGRRHTDVVVAKSANTAIEMMKGRVPNVLLTSQLLSPQDEARLADWLKDLGPAGTRVQALTIPILAPKAAAEEPQRGLLSGFRRRSKQGPQGCEPKMFAEHVSAYLEQGLVEGMEDVPALPEPAPEPIVHELTSSPLPEPESDTFITEVHVSAPHAAEEDEGLWLLTRSPQVIEFSDEPASEPDTAPLGLLPPVPSPQVLTLPTEVRPIAPFEVVFEPPQVITVRDDLDDLGLRRSVAEPVPPPAVLVPLEAAADALAPVQDEWGLFDPSKCGFAALLEKLEEITDDGRQAAPDTQASVRIVTHY